jgi:hypothetical protein
MNVSEKRAVQGIIEQRANEEIQERRRGVPKLEPPKALLQRLQAAVSAAVDAGWRPYFGANSSVELNPTAGNPQAKANNAALSAAVAAVEQARDDAIVGLWSSDEFDLAAVLTGLSEA